MLNSQTAVSHASGARASLRGFETDHTQDEGSEKRRGCWGRIWANMSRHAKPPVPVGEAPGFVQGLKAIIFASCEWHLPVLTVSVCLMTKYFLRAQCSPRLHTNISETRASPRIL